MALTCLGCLINFILFSIADDSPYSLYILIWKSIPGNLIGLAQLSVFHHFLDFVN